MLLPEGSGFSLLRVYSFFLILFEDLRAEGLTSVRSVKALCHNLKNGTLVYTNEMDLTNKEQSQVPQ